MSLRTIRWTRRFEDVSGIWDELEYLDQFDGDIEQVAAAVLGYRTRAIASDRSVEVIEALLTGDQLDAFLLDMGARYAASPTDNPKLVGAFLEGFLNR